MSIRVLLSDDETLARERLRSLLQEEPDLQIVAECGDGSSAIAAIQREKPDLVFLDVQMPEVDGFGVVEALQKQGTCRSPSSSPPTTATPCAPSRCTRSTTC